MWECGVCSRHESVDQTGGSFERVRDTAIMMRNPATTKVACHDDLFHHARAADRPLETCEFNIGPPNEPSRLYHEKSGITELGTQWLSGGSKRVSLQVAPTEAARSQAASRV